MLAGEEVKNPSGISGENTGQVKNAVEAERVAMKFIWNKFPKAKINIQKISNSIVRNKEIWSVEGNMEIKTGLFSSSEMRAFKVQISSDEEIMGYDF